MSNATQNLTRSLLGRIGLDRFSLAIIIWAPAYDEDTRNVTHWLDGLSLPMGAARHISIGTNVNRALVVSDLQRTRGLQRIKLFLGHAVSDALLGPPQGRPDDIILKDSAYSVIYDAEIIDNNPSALFAFCCDAGSQLANDFCNEDSKSFLGFSADIFIPILDKDCRKTWKHIIRTVAEAIIDDRSIGAKHETLLRKLYDEAMDYYSEGEGDENENAYYYLMQLNWQTENICRLPLNQEV